MGLLDEISYAPTSLMADAFPLTSQYRPDLPKAKAGQDRAKYGPRWDFRDGAKGYGWLGPMPTKQGVMTEYSTEDRQGRGLPQVVPTLNRSEIDYLLTAPQGRPAIPQKNRLIDDSMYQKAQDWAALRRLQGLSPFID